MSSRSCNTKHKDIYLPEMATVVKAESMTEMEYFLELKMDSGNDLGHMPGQFAEISIPGIGEAPISVSSSPTQRGSFEMVVRKVGNVSNAIHGLKPDDKVGVRGPYGTNFPVEDAMKGKDILFVCGGIGLVPVRSVINYVLDNRKDYGNVTILVGTKSPSERLFLDDINKWKSRDDITFIETVDRKDETWTGNIGVITTLFPKISINPANTVTIICGPPIMYKFVILELEKLGMADENVYVSLERRMKCGVGKCGHCQINGLYTCVDGPVFRFADVAEVREAI
ncbi:MAG: FAD/NAD(P)-binding protein [Candidatus Theseobacter exili]|nr:FAD/NAD(P)-binding protein [Candidatus Theseobacter exili]